MILENEVISIHLEKFDGKVFIHADVKRWSKSDYEHICGVLMELQEKYPIIYAYIPNEKVGKFAELFNFEWTDSTVELKDGKEYPVMRRG